jgi:hypothetical protein
MVNPSLNLNWMIGRRVREIQLERPNSWWFRFDDRGAIRADTFWRLIAAGRIHVTSEDHGQLFGLTEPVDSAVKAAEAVSSAVVQLAGATDSGDLVLHFDNGSRLEIFSTSSGYESWSVFYPSGDEAIGLGGGEIRLRKE